VILTKLVKRWSGCYFDKVIIDQLFWRIAIIRQNHVKNSETCSHTTSSSKWIIFNNKTLAFLRMDIRFNKPDPSTFFKETLVYVGCSRLFHHVSRSNSSEECWSKGINFIEQNIIFRFSIPETLTTDQGTFFIGQKVVQYANSWNIKLLTSSP